MHSKRRKRTAAPMIYSGEVTKTPEQQSCLMLHRTRQLFVRAPHKPR